MKAEEAYEKPRFFAPYLTISFCVTISTPAEGVKAEEAYEKDGTLPDPASTDNPEFQIVLRLIRDGLSKDSKK